MPNFKIFHCVLSMLFYSSSSYEDEDISLYEYGEHTEGEQVSYIYNGVIPHFKPTYRIENVMSQKEELQKNLTYLRAEYYNIFTKIEVEYNPEEYYLTFYVKFPFVETPFGILGLSRPKISDTQ